MAALGAVFKIWGAIDVPPGDGTPGDGLLLGSDGAVADGGVAGLRLHVLCRAVCPEPPNERGMGDRISEGRARELARTIEAGRQTSKSAQRLSSERTLPGPTRGWVSSLEEPVHRRGQGNVVVAAQASWRLAGNDWPTGRRWRGRARRRRFVPRRVLGVGPRHLLAPR